MKINHKKGALIILCFLSSIFIFGGCSKRTILYPAPIALDAISSNMKSAGYWTAKLAEPDKILLNGAQIDLLNKEFIKNNLLKDILSFKDGYYRKRFPTAYKKTLNSYKKYHHDSLKGGAMEKFINNINKSINYDILEPSFAIAVRAAAIRVLPTNQVLYSSYETQGLDRVQATQINLGAPLAVLYATKDYKWYFVVTDETEGWIEVQNIAFCSKDDLKQFLDKEVSNQKTSKKQNTLIVSISPITDIYADKEKTKFIEQINMGTELIAVQIQDDLVEIKLPVRDKKGGLEIQRAFVKVSDISVGYLKYTQRNSLTQAFKLLNYLYGWGGQDANQDCSSYIKNVFACFGIKLPRNSAAQIRQSSILKSVKFNKDMSADKRNQTIINQAIAGASLLYFPGHIMLYIGYENSQAYIIHSIWGYGAKNKKNKTFVINRVMVSDMNLGEDSKRGSLLERLYEIKNIAAQKE
jgi:hypothetical protein